MANACTNVKKRRTRTGLSFQLYTVFTWTNLRAHFRKSHLKSLKLKTLGKGFVSRCTRSFFFFFLKKKTSAITVYTPLGSHPSRVFFFGYRPSLPSSKHRLRWHYCTQSITVGFLCESISHQVENFISRPTLCLAGLVRFTKPVIRL